jgi:predicted adenylyl cyclase CyaB
MHAPRRNVEVKIRRTDGDDLPRVLRDSLGARDAGILEQQDVFFRVPRGRLKLRLQPQRTSQLIFYERTDEASLRTSDYRIVPCDEPEALRSLLAQALGEIGTVRKRRHLFLLDNVRFHLDEVDGLGSFLEIEAVLDPSHGERACFDAAKLLLQRLGLDRCLMESRAYIDLLLAEES